MAALHRNLGSLPKSEEPPSTGRETRKQMIATLFWAGVAFTVILAAIDFFGGPSVSLKDSLVPFGPSLIVASAVLAYLRNSGLA